MNTKPVLFISLILLTQACKSGQKIRETGSLTEKPGHSTISETIPAAVPSAASGITSFGFQLFRQLSAKHDHLIFSPYSISSAMAMCYAGARGNTAEEISRYMYFSGEQEKFHSDFRQLNSKIQPDMSSEGIDLKIANALWIQQDFILLDEYTDLIRSFYSARVQNLDFSTPDARDLSRNIINGWVQDQTNHKIDELIKPGILSPLTRAILTNAIYFHGGWSQPFQEEKNREGEFFPKNDRSITVLYMNQLDAFYYFEDFDFQALELPYQDKDYVMLIILPLKVLDLEEAALKLSDSTCRHIVSNMYKTDVRLSLPRFRSSSEFVLNEALHDMGIRDAFTRDADFSGMTGKKDLCIDVVIHKAFVELSETGTEAAAATGVEMALKSAYAGEPKKFVADHPFFYSVLHKESGTVIFAGWLERPADR